MELGANYLHSNPWSNAVVLEMKHIADCKVFLEAGHKAPVPEGHKNIHAHLIFDVKHDRRHRARLVADDGHLTDAPTESVHSGVVSLHGF